MQCDHYARDVNRHAVSEFVRRAAAAIPERSRVLDAGAGEARYRPFFTRHRYVAVDLAIGDPAWDYGKLDVLADLTRLPFRDEAFDHVLTTQTLEHLPDPSSFLAEAARVLRPGGRIWLTAPQSHKLHQEPHDYYRYTEYGLRYLLGKAGFEVETVAPQGGYLWFLADAIRPLHRKLFGRERGLAWLVPVAPLVLVSKILITRLLPLVFFHLDGLDTKKKMTAGNEAVAVKPERGSS